MKTSLWVALLSLSAVACKYEMILFTHFLQPLYSGNTMSKCSTYCQIGLNEERLRVKKQSNNLFSLIFHMIHYYRAYKISFNHRYFMT
uniref:Putative secreted protein midgut overexpressed n=1 Tax=Rhipicephalus microplus TaxID=6941 RepID=A0A6M2DDM2_RHIMP